MNEFSSLIADLLNNINSNKEFFRTTLIKKNPSLAYYKLNELANFVGSRYRVNLEIHFPDSNNIYNVEEYGKENLSIIIDKFRKTFPIKREQIKQKAIDSFINVKVIDAYMYEGKEGIKISFNDKSRSRIEVLPGSFHLWIKIDKNIESFCNWLLENIYSNR